MHLLTTAFGRTKLTDGVELSDPPPWVRRFMRLLPRRAGATSHHTNVDRVRPTRGCRLRVFFYKQLLVKTEMGRAEHSIRWGRSGIALVNTSARYAHPSL